MSNYSLSHLSNGTLLRDLQALVARDRTITAALLAHLAETDARKLYLPAGYPSMFTYCVQELRLSEDAAYKRIQAARAARQFPALFTAVAEGRLNLTGVGLLAPHLTPENADELLGSSAGKSKAEIEELVARRFPRSELLPMVRALPAPAPEQSRQLAPAQVGRDATGSIETSNGSLGARPVEVRPKMAPVAPERYALQLTIAKSTHDKLRYAQALLSHRIPNGDLAVVLESALDALIERLEKRKFAATDRPRDTTRSTRSARHLPAHVRRAVWQRDQGRCTFVSDSGRRCPSRKFLEFDHANPAARGGEATTENLRLRCRAHNQHAGECTFGAEFMARKRQEARQAAAEARGAVIEEQARARAEEQAKQEAEDQAKQQAKQKASEVIPWLRALGFRADEARSRAERCESIPDASLEERVRLALSYVSPRIASHRPAPA